MIKISTNCELEQILSSKKLALIYFGHDECGPCLMMKEVIKKLEEEIKDVDIYQVDTSKESIITKRLKITSIPTIVIIKGEKIVLKQTGYQKIDFFKNIILQIK